MGHWRFWQNPYSIKFIDSPEYDALSLLKSQHPMFSRMKMVECTEFDLCSIFRLKLVAIDRVLGFLEIFFMHMRVKFGLNFQLHLSFFKIKQKDLKPSFLRQRKQQSVKGLFVNFTHG